MRSKEEIYTQGVCINCGVNKQTSAGKYKGKKMFKPVCTSCHKAKHDPRLKHRKDYCELCGFVAVHKCQLDVDHIDGNSNNNSESNFQTLCANCHRLKTVLNMDWKRLED